MSAATWLLAWASWESPNRFEARATTRRRSAWGSSGLPAARCRTTSVHIALPSDTTSRGISRVCLSR